MDVALVCMPFAAVFSPSIGLSLLQAELGEQHLNSRVHYFTIAFAEAVGEVFYSDIAQGNRPELDDLPGEWLFNGALFGKNSRADARYLREVLEGYYPHALIAHFVRARERVNGFLDDCLDVLLRDKPRIVGFSSVFQQHTASLALAKRVKRASPSTFIVFGGANCEGVMGAETVRSFPFVDAAVSGEADLVFSHLVRRVIDGVSVADLPGVRTRDRIEQDFGAGVFRSGPMVHEMDRLPIPDYRDYFDEFKASRYHRDWQPSVPIETSRGCWWGQRTHCTFCGQNGATVAFRSKSPTRALGEVIELARRYPGCDIYAVDNILDLKYFEKFLPSLAAQRRKVSLFYQTKSNLKKEQVRRLRSAGVVAIFAGIESLSDAVLKLMRKGATGLQNIQLLKWCKEQRIDVNWNILWGLPGEPAEEYARMADLVPLLTHLPPPQANGRTRVDRFSPNFDEAPSRGFVDVRPLAAYKHVYRVGDSAVANLASHFTYRYAKPQDVDRYTRQLARELDKWRRVAPKSELLCVEAGEHLVIIDMRPVSQQPLTVLSGIARYVYRECDRVRDASELARAAAGTCGAMSGLPSIESVLASLVEQRLLLRDDSRYLALAIPVGEYIPSDAMNRRFTALIRRLGVPHGSGWIVRSGDGHCAHRAKLGHHKVLRIADIRFTIPMAGELLIERRVPPTKRRTYGQKEEENAEDERPNPTDPRQIKKEEGIEKTVGLMTADAEPAAWPAPPSDRRDNGSNG